MHSLPAHLQLIVESLCTDGCKTVHAYIDSLENNEVVFTMKGLTTAEHRLVLAELKTIMAVYDRRETVSLTT